MHSVRTTLFIVLVFFPLCCSLQSSVNEAAYNDDHCLDAFELASKLTPAVASDIWSQVSSICCSLLPTLRRHPKLFLPIEHGFVLFGLDLMVDAQQQVRESQVLLDFLHGS